MASHTNSKGTWRRWSVLLGVLVLFALGATTPAMGMNNESGSSTPWIASDKADYGPGELVTLNGGNWAAGESVHINVNDDEGKTWERNINVTATAAGSITDSFNLPDWFVATYVVTVTGSSGAVATTTFTDSNLRFLTGPTLVGPTLTSVSWQMYSDVNCTTAVSGAGTSGSGNITSVDGSATTLNVIAVAGQFIKLTAPASAGGQSFVDWTSTTGGGTFTTSDSGRSICAAGEANSGLRRFTATYAAPINSAPAIETTNASATVNEGQTANNNGTWSDANAGDTVTLSASVGTVTKSGTNAAGTWSWSYATTDGPAQSQTVTITANDGNGGVTTTTFALTVNNVAPSGTFNSPADVDEGSSFNLSLTGVTDPSSADDCGAGYGSYGASSSTSCSTATDGPATLAVKATVKDKDNGEREYTGSVTVNNVAPSGTFNSPANVNEGSSFTLSLTAVTDPSGPDTTAGFEYKFDCGAGYGAYGASSSTSCSTATDGPATLAVKATVKDKDGGEREYTGSVTVNNVPPTVELSASNTLTWDESATAERLFNYTASDPAGAADPLTMTINCGTGGSYVAGSDTGSSFKCKFTDGPASPTVSISADDGDGGTDSDSQNVTVNNVAPTVVAEFVPASVNCQTTATLTIDPDDAGANDSPWKVNINWGDGNTEPEISRTNLNSFNVTHVYALAGPYNATVSVTDKDAETGFDLVNGVAINQTYTVDFLAPFDDSNPSGLIVNKMKNGRVVPVKVTIYDDCGKASVTDPAADVTIKVSKTAGTGAGDPIEEYADAGESSSGTDEFRWANPFWIYNLDSKALGLIVNNVYRIDVYVGLVKATVSNWAVLQPVK